jgi:histidinol dehydrogenase
MRVERIQWDGTGPAGRAARQIRSLSSPAAPAAEDAAQIVDEVRERGDDALRLLTSRLDATDMRPADIRIRVDAADIERAREQADPGLIGALEVAARNIEGVARAELRARGEVRVSLAQGQTVSVVEHSVRSAGVYVPGGRAAYPSSVLMGFIPARVAGVGRVAVATPPGAAGRVHAVTLAACAVAGADEVYSVGGAQAIAALAYGTETVAAVDVIAGPGNRYVNAAKRLAFGDVGVDGIAGPSELAVVLDGQADLQALALDLLAQAEHGTDGLLTAISADSGALGALSEALSELAPQPPRAGDAMVALVHVADVTAAIELVDAIAPEHLELAIAGADARLAEDRVAGAVFFGRGGAVAFGDYAAGANHVLPTGGVARFGGPLGVGAFRRRTSVVDLDADAVTGLAPRVAAIARAEGFEVHARSAEARTGE